MSKVMSRVLCLSKALSKAARLWFQSSSKVSVAVDYKQIAMSFSPC